MLAACASGGSLHSTRASLVAPDPWISGAGPDGGTITTYAIPSGASPFRIARGSDGNMWFTEQIPYGNIGRVTPGGIVTEFPVANNHDGECITAGRGNVLWFASNQSRLIGKISTSGQVSTFTAPGIAPYCVAMGSDGNVWFTDTANGAIGRLNTRSGHIDEFKLPSASSVPLEMTAGPDGNVWFSDNSNGMVGKATPTGAITEFALPSGANSRPYGIAAGPDGALYVGEILSGNIARVTTSGTVTEFAVGGVGANGLALGPDKQIWFSGSGIERFVVSTHKVWHVANPPNGARVMSTSPGPDHDVWFTASGPSASQNYIGLFEEKSE